MIHQLLSKRLHPQETPNNYVTEKTTPEFVHQMMTIIHESYGNRYNPMFGSYSHNVMMVYVKANSDFHLPAGEQFEFETLYETLEESKDMDFFDLLDCMLYVINQEASHNGRIRLEYEGMIADMNESMRLHGIGYKIVDGALTVQTEETIYNEITAPCLNILRRHRLTEADDFIKDSFQAYKEGLFTESVNNAAKALENVCTSIAVMKKLDIDPEKTKMPDKLRAILKEGDFPKQMGEHLENLMKIIQTPMSVRNERAAHGNVVRDMDPAMARYVIDTVCVDILFLVRTCLE